MKALYIIKQYQLGNKSLLKNYRWLQHLTLSSEQNYNLERLKTLEELKNNVLLQYVIHSLEILETYELSNDDFQLIEDTLIWSEVAKGGMAHQRKIWLRKGFDLAVHNLGSSEIYCEEAGEEFNEIVENLIATHGLIGQYIRGEVELGHSSKLYEIMDNGLIEHKRLVSILRVLNHCIIGAVNKSLWKNVQVEVEKTIGLLLSGYYERRPAIERLKGLRKKAITNGEDFDRLIMELKKELLEVNIDLESLVNELFYDTQFWYFESAIHDFSLEEAIKILLIIDNGILNKDISHISFESIMKSIYYDHDGVKKVNLFKKRIVEHYLEQLSFVDITLGNLHKSPHLKIALDKTIQGVNTLQVSFAFTKAAEKLIEFCIEAEKSGSDYERSVIILYDYFDLRKDAYDRFHNEGDYLETMNKSIDYKKVIIDHITGEKVIDIGPGGGALMDLIETTKPDISVTGLDVSSNVIETLEKKRRRENHKWNIKYGDALNLSKYLDEGEADTIIFCSIIHELFSYIEYNEKRFNREVIDLALKSAFSVLPPGGRIIIRDGIMTEPESQNRIVSFKSAEGMEFLRRYAKDFEGRQIQYERIGHNKVLMPVNDAMEFLYTYTWGEDSYIHEINEQFGYFTPKGYVDFIKSSLGEKANIIVSEHYLQDGYTTALMPKVNIYSEEGMKCRLPDSTCLIVIEKNNSNI